MAKRIVVEWMTHVPVNEDGSHDFDAADWAFKQFRSTEMKRARAFAQAEANRNAFGQTWLNIDSAPGDNPRDWQFDRDYDAQEIFTAATPE